MSSTRRSPSRGRQRLPSQAYTALVQAETSPQHISGNSPSTTAGTTAPSTISDLVEGMKTSFPVVYPYVSLGWRCCQFLWDPKRPWISTLRLLFVAVLGAIALAIWGNHTAPVSFLLNVWSYLRPHSCVCPVRSSGALWRLTSSDTARDLVDRYCRNESLCR